MNVNFCIFLLFLSSFYFCSIISVIMGGWVGRWCLVASSAGASYGFGIWWGRGLLCLQQVRDGWAVFFFFLLLFFISSILSSFSNASSLGRRLDILKYCGLGHYNQQ